MSEPPTPLDRVRAAYDPETFRGLGHSVIDQLTDYLARVSRGDGPVLPPASPAAMAEAFPGPAATPPPAADLAALLSRVIAASNHLHHPRYVGHQVTAPLPEAALCDLVAAFLNNGMAVFEMGPAGTAIERAAVRLLADALGLGPRADGVLTSGGSAANLTALLAARQAKAGFDAWTEGGGGALAVLGAEQAHYSVRRAAQIMGWGERGLWPVAVDARLRLDPEALPGALRAAAAAGRRVLGVVASACSTAAGAYDPLEPIADFCEANGLWLHVDGAHGAAAALSPKYRRLVRGIERADSVVWDAHKLLLMPALVSAVLFKDGARSYQAFAQEAPYLFPGGADEGAEHDLGRRTLECTKRMMGLKLYAAFATRGAGFFGDYVTGVYDLARRFAEKLRASPDFELALEPESDIVCFRYKGPGASDARQEELRRRLLARGQFYLVQTRLPGGVYLRVTLINPLTREEDLDALLDAIREAAG